jgi:outer membrane protein OmpA-like peptidoglycan-associated protein
MRTHLSSIAAVLLASAPVADADPDRSQNPRIGLLAEIEFDRDSAQLGWGASRELGRVAGWAITNPGGVIVLEGYADRTGSAAYNVDLSLRRVNAVRRELVDAGVPPEQLVLAAFGERGGEGAKRRVAIWATRTSKEAVAARLHASEPAVVRSGEETAESIVVQR